MNKCAWNKQISIINVAISILRDSFREVFDLGVNAKNTWTYSCVQLRKPPKLNIYIYIYILSLIKLKSICCNDPSTVDGLLYMPLCGCSRSL